MFLKFLLCGVTIALVVSAEESEDLEGNCGDTFNKTTGNFSTPDIDPGKNKNCTWIIQAGNESNPSVTLQFTGIDFLSGNDSLDVYANENETLPIATFANAKVPGPVIVISFDSVTKIVFRRGSGNMTGKFSASFNTVNCTQTLMAMQGVINSPIYQNGTGNVSCTYNVNMTGNKDVVLLSTKDFYLPNGTLDVTFQKTTTTLKGVGNQNDVFGDAGTQSFSLKLTLNNDPKPQKFSALFTTVNKDCSGQLNALDGDTTMTFGPNQFPVKCHVQLVAKTNKTVYASAGSKAAQRVHLYDGGSINAPVIGDFSAGSWYSSSGQTMTLIAYRDSSNSPFNFTFRQVDRAFYSLTIGEIQSLQLKTDKRVQFLTDTNSKLNIEFNTNTTSLSGNATVILQDGGDQTFGTQIFSFSADTPLFPVLSPSNRLIVSVQGVSGGNVVDINVTAVRLGNSRVYTDNNAEINWEVLAETKCIMGIINSSNTASTDIITFSLSSLTLCGKSTLSVYKGFKKSAQLLATYTPASAPILNIRFPAAEGAKFEWADPQKTCSGAQPILMANYWTQSEGTACGNYSEATNGTITSPGYPDSYPLNTHCNYPLKDQANSSLYVTLTSIQLDPAHNLTLNRNGTPIRYFRNSSETFHPLTVDAIVPSENLSLDFDARTVNGSDSQKPNAGYNLSFRFLTCGGVMKAKNATITSPVNVTQSTECIWIIQLQKDGPDKSVNIIHASISLTGITNSSRDVLEVRDGGSARDILVKKENYTDFLTRTNYLWIRYFVDVSNKTNSVEADMPFAFSLNYTEKTCNQSSLCANGLCMHENWQCNDVNDCGDWSDEKNCNGSHPFPPPTTAKPHPEPQGGSKGVKAYWIAICLILGIILGGMIVYFIPRCYRRIKYPNYSHLRDSLSPSEA